MFNAESLIDVIRDGIVRTEIDTTRSLARVIRQLPAGYPPSEIADTLDAMADELDGRMMPPPRVDTRGASLGDGTAREETTGPGNWRHVGCTGTSGTVFNPQDADKCRGCGYTREELEMNDEVELVSLTSTDPPDAA